MTTRCPFLMRVNSRAGLDDTDGLVPEDESSDHLMSP
jgi:hypothetical protein